MADAFDAEEDRTRGELERMNSPLYLPFNHEHFSYVGKSVYVDQVRRYLKVFPREQVMIIQSERFFRETPTVVREVFDFLGIDPSFVPENLAPSNVSRQKKEQLPPGLQTKLEIFFAEKNEALYELIGERFDW